MRPGEKIEIENLEYLIQQHMAFIIRTVSSLTGRYVAVENDEEFSIALSAFAEAVAKYDEKRGSFLGFAKLVMESRLKTYLAREKTRPREASLDSLYENGQDFPDEREDVGRTDHLREEVILYKEELALFGLTLEILADEAPKHRDTRENALDIAQIASNDPPTVKATYEKKRLPVRAVARIAQVTEKVVKRSRHFILAAMIIFVKAFPELSRFIGRARCSDVL